MTFIVNGAEWSFDGMTGPEIEQLIDNFLGFANTSIGKKEVVLIGDDFQQRAMFAEMALWEMLSEQSGLNLSGELRQELAAWLGPINYYADSDDWPDGADDHSITIDDALTENPDVAWVHHSLRAGIPAACITLGKPAVRQTVTIAGSKPVHFVEDERGRQLFWRDMIAHSGDDVGSLIDNAPRAYPSLHFIDGVLQDVSRLSGGYLASRERVKHALAVLNDWGAWVFSAPPPILSPKETSSPNDTGNPSNQLMESRFAGLGIEVAPEKPNVRGNKQSREARETSLNGRLLYCEWHVKLERHRNRIHIHGPIPESGGKVVIGMIDEHLPLP